MAQRMLDHGIAHAPQRLAAVLLVLLARILQTSLEQVELCEREMRGEVIRIDGERPIEGAARRRVIAVHREKQAEIRPGETVQRIEPDRAVHRADGFGNSAERCEPDAVQTLNAAVAGREGERLLAVRARAREVERLETERGSRTIRIRKLRRER